MRQRSVLEYLEATVRRLPGKVAYADEECALTFEQVYRISRAVGSALTGLGLTFQPVAVFLPKSPKTIAAFFGCVWAGDAYVPLDPEMPAFRVERIFGTLEPKAVICCPETAKILAGMGYAGQVLDVDDIAGTAVDEAALAAVRERQIDTDPLYIVFTSGSTGVPKGVVACHRSVIDYIEQLSGILGFSEETVFANQSPLYFDACLKEIYPTVKFGATAYLTPRTLFSFPVRLVEYLNAHRVNTVCWVASALTLISSLNTFDKIKPEYLRTVAFGSEVFPPKQLARWRAALPDAVFTNLYGPTEATGMCCYYRVDRDFAEDGVIPIGRPFPNREILLLGADDCPVRDGEIGEICVRGTSLALGYYRDPQRTAEVFTQNPLNPDYPELIYRTGDLGRRNERGELVFISRKDFQIKHMGHRIELSEIEAVTGALEGIFLCCCLYDTEKDRIGLFYTGSAAEGELYRSLKARLPRYMLPGMIKRLDAFPMTPNGKPDRQALREMPE